MQQQRDLIILTKSPFVDEDALEKQVQSISSLLSYAESMDAFCVSNEIIDINHYKIIDAPYLVQKIVADKEVPFVFLFNKN